MTSALQTFKMPTGGKLRAMEIERSYFFVGKDAAKLLGYANTKEAIKRHVSAEDKRVVKRDPSDARQITIISESGLYSLILSSKLPEAKAFKRWVTAEVLPALRSTGSYSVAPAPVATPSLTYNWAEKHGYYYVYTVDHAHRLTWHAKFVTAEAAARYCTIMNDSRHTPNSLTV